MRRQRIWRTLLASLLCGVASVSYGQSWDAEPSAMPGGLPSLGPASYYGDPTPWPAAGLDSTAPWAAACGPDGGCPVATFWGRVDYLHWWLRERYVPTLITTSPANTPLADAGVLDAAGTQSLFADDRTGAGGQSGLGLEGGWWFTADQSFGVGARYLQISGKTAEASFTSNGDPILARPFSDVSAAAAGSLVVAYPGIATGTVAAGDSVSIDMADVFLRKLLLAAYDNRVDLIGGYQYAEVENTTFARHTLESLDPNGRVPVGTVLDSRDEFRASNEFQGGFIGLLSEARDGRWNWRLLSKLALGNMHEVATIRGTTTATVPNAGSATSAQGLLALPTNIGSYEQDEFVLMPEAQVSATYQLTCGIGISIGYSLVYWDSLVTSGNLIDTTINASQLDGALIGDARPTFQWDNSQFWAQGFTLGIDARF